MADKNLLPGWEAFQTDEGEWYYYHEGREETTWDKPEAPKAAPKPAPRQTAPKAAAVRSAAPAAASFVACSWRFLSSFTFVIIFAAPAAASAELSFASALNAAGSEGGAEGGAEWSGGAGGGSDGRGGGAQAMTKARLRTAESSVELTCKRGNVAGQDRGDCESSSGSSPGYQRTATCCRRTWLRHGEAADYAMRRG